MKLAKPETLGFSPARLERIHTVTQRYIDEGKFAGIVTLIARRGKLVHFASVGKQEIEGDKPMKNDSLFRIYSMTKPITTTAAMMLFEEGALRLSDPVAKYIPEFAETKVLVKQGYAGPVLEPQATPMTIRQLMTHTAGLSYGFMADSPIEEMYRQLHPFFQTDPSSAEIISKWAAIPLIQQPGKAWRYSVATDVLGRVVEVVSGMSLREFFLERIFKPLGMDDTDYYVPASKMSRFATCYGPAPTGGIAPILPPMISDAAILHRASPGGHGLHSTAADYLRFCQMILNGGELDGVRLLGRKSVELMSCNHLAPEMLPIERAFEMHGLGFGLGFSVLLDPAQRQSLGSCGSIGWGGAANTNFWIDPKEELIGILMAQFMPSNTFPLVDDFRTLTYQALVD
jgi:CubicO group peptidase (beta-lactamase class C family)